MRKTIGIIVCLFLSLQLSAISYQTATYSAPPTGFRSTSAYSASRPTPSSLSAISTANYEALNSEGGACYNGPRRGRPKEGDYGNTGAIGSADFRSPVGDIPWYLFGLLAALYGLIIQKKRT